MSFLSSLFDSIKESLSAALKLPARQFLDLLADGLDAIIKVLPEKFSKQFVNAAESLRNITQKMEMDIQLSEERGKNMVSKAFATAYEKSTYKNVDFYGEQEDRDRAAKRLEENQQKTNSLIEKTVENNKKGTDELNKQDKIPAAQKKGETQGAGSSLAGVLGGGARWTAKPLPIIEAAKLDTGIYKNTGNMSIDQQAALSASSNEIGKYLSGVYGAREKQAMAQGDFTGLAQVQKEKAIRQQEMQENDLRRQQYMDKGWTKASAQEQVDLEKQKYGKPLLDAVNKTGGPSGSGSTAGAKDSQGGGQKQDPLTAAISSIKDIVQKIHDNKLPIQALTA